MALAAKAPEERRRRILAAAVEVLKAKGFAGARIADIAAEAGTSPALVVYHFKSLDGALAEALTTLEDDFYDQLAVELPRQPDAYGRLRLLATLGAESGPAVGHWALWMEVWVRALRDTQARALRRVLDSRWRATLRGVIEQGTAEGAWTCADPGASAVRLAALMDGLAVQVALDDPDVPAERMADLWLAGASSDLHIDPPVVSRPGPSSGSGRH